MMETLIKGEMVRWARERAALTQDELAEKLHVSSEKVKEWESGELPIVMTKAKALAKISLLPYGLLFADHPPEEKLPIADFRTHGSDIVTKPSPELLETINDAKLKQEWYREYLISEESEPLDFIGKYDIHANPELVAIDLKKILAINEEKYFKFSTWESTFSYLIECAEDAGITIIVNSILKNNTHRPLNEDEFRGFVLSDDYAPIIFINGRDAKAARMFTLIHEIAHLVIGASGVLDDTLSHNHSLPQERWCNRVAAEFLTPRNRFLRIWNKNESIDNNLENLRRQLKVSKLVCIYRAYELNCITNSEKKGFISEEMSRIHALKKKDKEKTGGPDPYVIRRYRTGRNLALAVLSEVNANRMLYRDAFRLLGVKNTHSLNEFSNKLGY